MILEPSIPLVQCQVAAVNSGGTRNRNTFRKAMHRMNEHQKPILSGRCLSLFHAKYRVGVHDEFDVFRIVSYIILAVQSFYSHRTIPRIAMHLNAKKNNQVQVQA